MNGELSGWGIAEAKLIQCFQRILNKQDGLFLVELTVLGGCLKHIPEPCLASQDSGKGIEMRFGQIGDDHDQGGLARAWETPQEDG
jgi:hypothetical protein